MMTALPIRRLVLVLMSCAPLLVAGCGSELEAPAELTLQTRNALDVLPADVQIVGSFNAATAKDNPTVATFRLDEVLYNDVQSREAYDQLTSFMTVTGFDPHEDVEQVFIALRPPEGEQPPQINLAVYATFDKDRMESYLEEEQSAHFSRDSYQGTTIYLTEGDTQGEGLYVAFANDEMMLASSSRVGLHVMLDNLSGGGRALSSNAELMALIRQVPDPDGGWLVLHEMFDRADIQPAEASEDRFAQLAPMLRDMIVSTRFEDDGVEANLLLFPKSGISTDDVADVMRGAMAAAKASAKRDTEALALMDRVEVRARGNHVRANVFLNEADLDRMQQR